MKLPWYIPNRRCGSHVVISEVRVVCRGTCVLFGRYCDDCCDRCVNTVAGATHLDCAGGGVSFPPPIRFPSPVSALPSIHSPVFLSPRGLLVVSVCAWTCWIQCFAHPPVSQCVIQCWYSYAIFDSVFGRYYDYFGDRCATTESGAPHARTALVEGRYQALTVGVTVVPSASADLQQPSSPSILQCLALQCVSRRRTSIGSSVKMGIRRSERDASEIPYLRP